MEILRVALCQINCKVGDLEHNFQKISSFIEKSLGLGSKIICFPELSIIGYPPEDIVFYPYFLEKQYDYLEKLKKYSKDVIIIVGFVNLEDNLYNSAAVIVNNDFFVYNKINLPNYGVFDEDRYFKGGNKLLILHSEDNIKIGITICEDIWYPTEPLLSLAKNSVDIIFNISASPYHFMKPKIRERIFRTRAMDYSTFIAFCNLVGGQDELVFDGNSCVIDNYGRTISRAPSFQEYLLTVDITQEQLKIAKLSPILKKIPSSYLSTEVHEINFKLLQATNKVNTELFDFLDEEEEVFKACVLGTRDYVLKNNFEKVIIGMSGGIDSSLVSCIAKEALGKDRVLGLSMPSMFSSVHSVEDAQELASNLQIDFKIVKITSIYDCFIQSFEEVYSYLGNTGFTVAEENLQARIRGIILMTLSNKFGYLVLSCGNKSEVSMGYSTLYGDLAGGFAPIKDLYKTQVYKIARWYNKTHRVIPQRVFEKEPSAELRPNQRDQDTLPPYEILDQIIKMYVEENFSPYYISETLGLDIKYIEKILKTLENAEYKRRQSPPGVKLTPKYFGKDRRFPITKKIF